MSPLGKHHPQAPRPKTHKVRWKTFTTSRVGTTALKKALPEVAATYTKTITARRFSIK